jgi:glycerate dehydrogenase
MEKRRIVKMNICVFESDGVCGNDLSMEILSSFGDISFHPKYEDPKKVIEAIGDSTVVLCSKVLMTREIFDACPQLKYIGLTATGYNNVDLKAATEKGIVVTNVPDYSSDAVCQMTFAYLLQFATNLIAYDQSVKNGEWVTAPAFSYSVHPMMELKGKTLGVYGLGSIGNKVAHIARQLGMNVIYHSRTEKAVPYTYVNAETLFRSSDFITLHCPLTPETENLVNESVLNLMKKTAFLINTARGALVDEGALAAALNEGRIAGYAADVLVAEPQAANCPLLGAKNCILTPHVSWAPFETRRRLLRIVVENLENYLKNNPKNVINA